MNTAAKMQPVNEPLEDRQQDAGWDPYQVWKEQVGGVARTPLNAFDTESGEATWSPYDVWMQHVARKP